MKIVNDQIRKWSSTQARGDLREELLQRWWKTPHTDLNLVRNTWDKEADAKLLNLWPLRIYPASTTSEICHVSCHQSIIYSQGSPEKSKAFHKWIEHQHGKKKQPYF